MKGFGSLSQAVVRLTIKEPFWTELLYSMEFIEVTKDHELADQIKTAATDGARLWCNAEFFKGLDVATQIAVLVHEIMHKMLLHSTRIGHRDPKLWNYAADFAINGMMKKQGTYSLAAQNWLQDDAYDGMTAEQIYTILSNHKTDEKKSAGAMPNGQTPNPAFDDLKYPGGTPEEIARIEQKIKGEVERAIANAKAIGKLPAGIEKDIGTTYAPAKEPWYNHLHRYMQSLASGQYNWSRINRRALLTHGVFAPHHYSEALDQVVVFIDTSGSCYEKAQQADFASHINAILSEAKPRETHIVYFDADVYPGEVFGPGEVDVALRPRGGGGTDFRPLFAYLEQEDINPAVAIVLTDLMGPFGDEPAYPVIWASVHPGQAPWGETIHVE